MTTRSMYEPNLERGTSPQKHETKHVRFHELHPGNTPPRHLGSDGNYRVNGEEKKKKLLLSRFIRSEVCPGRIRDVAAGHT